MFDNNIAASHQVGGGRVEIGRFLFPPPNCDKRVAVDRHAVDGKVDNRVVVNWRLRYARSNWRSTSGEADRRAGGRNGLTKGAVRSLEVTCRPFAYAPYQPWGIFRIRSSEVDEDGRI